VILPPLLKAIHCVGRGEKRRREMEEREVEERKGRERMGRRMKEWVKGRGGERRRGSQSVSQTDRQTDTHTHFITHTDTSHAPLRPPIQRCYSPRCAEGFP
jgi:hypothetical protein